MFFDSVKNTWDPSPLTFPSQFSLFHDSCNSLTLWQKFQSGWNELFLWSSLYDLFLETGSGVYFGRNVKLWPRSLRLYSSRTGLSSLTQELTLREVSYVTWPTRSLDHTVPLQKRHWWHDGPVQKYRRIVVRTCLVSTMWFRHKD